nr:MAG TPA: hypothetical protein [Caudoviricetes sp.]
MRQSPRASISSIVRRGTPLISASFTTERPEAFRISFS